MTAAALPPATASDATQPPPSPADSVPAEAASDAASSAGALAVSTHRARGRALALMSITGVAAAVAAAFFLSTSASYAEVGRAGVLLQAWVAAAAAQARPWIRRLSPVATNL